MAERVKVIVWASGGVVTGVSAGAFVDVVIHDEDERDDENGLALSVSQADPWTPECDDVWNLATNEDAK